MLEREIDKRRKGEESKWENRRSEAIDKTGWSREERNEKREYEAREDSRKNAG